MNAHILSFLLLGALASGLAASPAGVGGVPERRTVERTPKSSDRNNPDSGTIDLGNVIRSGRDYRSLSRDRFAIVERSSAADAAVFFNALLEDRRPPALLPGQWHAFVNAVFGSLANGTSGDFDRVSAFIEVAREAPDDVIRDYALQHLAVLASAEKVLGGSERNRIMNELREAAGKRGSLLSGTALLNLYHLGDGVEDGALADHALAVAADPAAHEAARSTALQVGVLLKDKRFLEPAVEIARRSPIVAHRASATRAIAVFGGPEERTLLLQLRRRGPEPIANIANEALARIENDR